MVCCINNECCWHFSVSFSLSQQMKLNVQCVPLGPTRSISVVGMSWFNRIQSVNRPSLAICYETGKFQIMRNENDDGMNSQLNCVSSHYIDFILYIRIKWKTIDFSSNNNRYEAASHWLRMESRWFCASFVRDENIRQWKRHQHCNVLFTIWRGRFGRIKSIHIWHLNLKIHFQHLRTLKIPGHEVTALAWEGQSLRIALAVDSFIYFANIRPDYMWCYFGKTVCFLNADSTKTGNHIVTFWDTNSNQCNNKHVDEPIAMASSLDHCVIAVECPNLSSKDSNVVIANNKQEKKYQLLICNSISTTVDCKLHAIFAELSWTLKIKSLFFCSQVLWFAASVHRNEFAVCGDCVEKSFPPLAISHTKGNW